MDESDFQRIAARLVRGEERGKKKDPTGPEPEGDPDWKKVQTMFDTSVKNTFTDLRQAVRDEDSKLAVYHMERLLEAIVKMAKYMKMREVFMKLREVEKKVFD